MIERGISLPETVGSWDALVSDARKHLLPGTSFKMIRWNGKLAWVVNPLGARATAEVLAELTT